MAVIVKSVGSCLRSRRICRCELHLPGQADDRTIADAEERFGFRDTAMPRVRQSLETAKSGHSANDPVRDLLEPGLSFPCAAKPAIRRQDQGCHQKIRCSHIPEGADCH